MLRSFSLPACDAKVFERSRSGIWSIGRSYSTYRRVSGDTDGDMPDSGERSEGTLSDSSVEEPDISEEGAARDRARERDPGRLPPVPESDPAPEAEADPAPATEPGADGALGEERGMTVGPDHPV